MEWQREERAFAHSDLKISGAVSELIAEPKADSKFRIIEWAFFAQLCGT